MTQVSNLSKTQYQNLFKEFAYFTKDYGMKPLLYQLYILNNSKEKLDTNNSEDELLMLELSKSFQNYGVEFTTLFFQTNKTKMFNFESEINSALNDKVFEIVCRVFRTTRDAVLEKFDRDGVRVYASGSLFKLYIDTCGYSVDEVVALTGKPKSIISRHKNIITNLDYKHIHDKKVVLKFIDAKKQLIKYILDEYRQEN